MGNSWAQINVPGFLSETERAAVGAEAAPLCQSPHLAHLSGKPKI
jgi:hypothetical protein